MVLLSARGYPVAQIAEVCGVGEDVARKWRHRYQAGGPPGLEDRPRPGRPPNDRLARHIVDAQASHPPCNSGLVQGGWTAGLLATFLATFLAARFRLVLSSTSVRRYLHGTGWRWARPRLAPATHAPRGRRKEDPAAPLKLALIAQAVASAAPLL
jgi:transposase